MTVIVRLIGALVLFFLALGPAAATEAGWALLREGGHVVLMRHAITPGTNDPSNFAIDDCRSQRALSERGRQQARRIGSLFAARAEPTERVLSSRYCRTMDTARLAFDTDLVEPFEALDPVPAEADRARDNRLAILSVAADYSGSGNLVMVTHQDVIRSLTGESTREGEVLIVRPDGDRLHVMGRIVFN